MNNLKINFTLFENDLPQVTSSKIFANNKNEFHEEGLYSQKIFGPVKNYECKCGKLKGKFFKGQRCDECGVLCDDSDLRMKTFAQINLPKDIWVIYPPLKYILQKLFSKKAIDKILNFDPHVYEKDDFYIYDLENQTLVNIYDIIDNKEIDKIYNEMLEELNNENLEEEDEEEIHKKLEQLKIKLVEEQIGKIDSKRYLVNFRVYSIVNLKRLFDYLLENHWEIFENKDLGSKEIVKHTFINKVLVTPPDTRPIVKIAKNRFSVNDITKSYSEILKNLEHKFMDEIYLSIKDQKEKEIYLSNASKKFQKSIDEIYKWIQEKQFGDKDSLFRNSLLGKTVEFSSRTVVTCGPNVPPYMISMPRDTAKTLFILETLNYLINNENDIIDISEVAGLMQLIVNKIEDANLDISNDDFDEIFEKIRPQLRVMFERPPTLFMYNDSTFILDKLFEKKFKLED